MSKTRSTISLKGALKEIRTDNIVKAIGGYSKEDKEIIL